MKHPSANPSFGMTMTKTLRCVFLWCVSTEFHRDWITQVVIAELYSSVQRFSWILFSYKLEGKQYQYWIFNMLRHCRIALKVLGECRTVNQCKVYYPLLQQNASILFMGWVLMLTNHQYTDSNWEHGNSGARKKYMNKTKIMWIMGSHLVDSV